MKMANLFSLCFLISTLASVCLGFINSNSKCEDLRSTVCQDLPYNKTFFPNSLNHQSQNEAIQLFQQFHLLISANCYEDTKLFLCSLFFPICTKINVPILPCRTLCKKARKGCLPKMTEFGIQWPEILRCKKFPKKSSGQICIERNSRKAKKNNKRG